MIEKNAKNQRTTHANATAVKKNANATISGFSNRKNITNAIEVKKP
jgi:hypothetical protein